MREIKFRVWDVDSKQFADGVCIHQNGEVFVGRAHPADELIIQQFTGLTDKTGREIYEGDILRNNEANWEVGFDEGGFWMRLRPDQHKFIFINEAQHSEIVGNIYENRELLK